MRVSVGDVALGISNPDLIENPGVTENLSAAFLLLDGAVEDVPIFQLNKRGEEKEGKKKKKEEEVEERSVLLLLEDTAPGNMPWHGMEDPRKCLLRRLLKHDHNVILVPGYDAACCYLSRGSLHAGSSKPYLYNK